MGKKEDVERLGFAWYLNAKDPTRGMLRNPRTGCLVSHEHARTTVGSLAGSDVANLQDIQDYEELAGTDESSEFDEEDDAQIFCKKSSCVHGSAWLIRIAVLAMGLVVAVHTFVSSEELA